MSRIERAISEPDKVVAYCREKVVDWYIGSHNALRRSIPAREFPATPKEFQDVHAFAQQRSDISDHLPTIFSESLRRKPAMIVELGVRRGSSTYVFERVARICDSILLSVDIEECSELSTYSNWYFVRADDVMFGEQFRQWCASHSAPDSIDVLFIDTSHTYEHTKGEIATWFKYLSDHALVIFHDTNMKEVYRRLDGTIGHGWNNSRGVIQAVQEYLDCPFDETVNFTGIVGGWLIRHYANCSGLTILEKLS